MRHDPLYIPEGPIDDAPGAWTRAVDEARDAERRADAALNELFGAREAAARARDGAARSLADYLAHHLADLPAGVPGQAASLTASLTAEYVARRAAWREADDEYLRAFDKWEILYEQRKRLEDDDLEEGGGSGA